MWLRQMAHVSTTMSHAHRATALYFLISKRFFSVDAGPAAAAPPDVATAVEEEAAAAPPPTGPVATASISMARADQGRRQRGMDRLWAGSKLDNKGRGRAGVGRKGYGKRQRLEQESGSGSQPADNQLEQRGRDHGSRWRQRSGRGGADASRVTTPQRMTHASVTWSHSPYGRFRSSTHLYRTAQYTKNIYCVVGEQAYRGIN